MLTIAGFDPSCGAGTAADLKIFAAHDCYGVAAITVADRAVHARRDRCAAHAERDTARATRCLIERFRNRGGEDRDARQSRQMPWSWRNFSTAPKFAHVVHDPVMKSSQRDGDLLDAAGIKFVNDELLKRSTVITPNMPEAEILTGITIKDIADMEAAARKIVEMGAHAVIVKGGHMETRRRCAVRWQRDGDARRRSRA